MPLALTKSSLPEPRRGSDPIPVNLPGKATALARRTRIDEQRDLSAKARAVKNERLRFCREVYALTQKGYTQAQAASLAATHTDTYPLLVHAGKNDSTALTLRNYRSWMKRLGKHRNGRPNWDHHMALADRYCTTVQEPAGDGLFWTVFHRFYLNPNKLSLAESWRLACQQARAAGVPQDQIPAQHQVAYWVRKYMPKDQIILAREGEEAYRNTAMSYVRRDWSDIPVGEVVFGDHHQFDAFVQTTDADGRVRATRPWLTAWMDIRSLMFTGWCVRTESPDSLSILIALEQALQTMEYRVPRLLYSDNGKDYLIRGFTQPAVVGGHEHSICAELGTSFKTALPYNARSKPIERQFGEVCRRFSKLWPSYCGSNAKERPEKANYFLDHPEELPDVKQFSQMFAAWVMSTYNRTPGQGKILDGESPAQVWERLDTTLPQLTPDQVRLKLLHPVAGRPGGCHVYRGGVVRAGGEEWRAPELRPLIDRKVLLKVDRLSGSGVYAYHLDGRQIAHLERVPTVRGIADSQEQQILLGNELQRQHREIRDARKAIDAATDGLPGLSPIDYLMIDHSQPAALETTGSRRSVAGHTHNFRHRVARQGDLTTRLGSDSGDPATPIPGTKDSLSTPTDSPKQSPEAEFSADDLAGFGESVLSRGRAGNDDFDAADLQMFGRAQRSTPDPWRDEL